MAIIGKKPFLEQADDMIVSGRCVITRQLDDDPKAHAHIGETYMEQAAICLMVAVGPENLAERLYRLADQFVALSKPGKEKP